MSNQITAAFVQQFTDNVIMLSQQKGSKLRGLVTEKMITGNSAYFERLGPTEVLLRTSRHAPSPTVDTPHSRRKVDLASYEWGDVVDQQDSIRMLIDPKSLYAQNAVMSFGRKIDQVIIAAATGTSQSVSSSLPNANNITSVSFDSSMIVDEDFGTGDSNLTIAKLIEARRLLSAKDVDENEELTLVCNASAIAALLNTTQVTSSDYNTVQALVQGNLDTYLGFKFVRTELISGSLSSSTDPKLCFAFLKSGIGLAVGQDVNMKMAERPDLGFSTYIYGSMDIGATRIEEEKVVQIECYQTA